MNIRDMKCILIVVSLVIAGCASEKTTTQKGVSQSPRRAMQASIGAGQQVSPGVDKKTGGTFVPASRNAVADKRAEPTERLKRPDVVFVPTPQEVVDRMLELAQVTKDDLVYDLGCGDGRIVVTAAKKYGCKAFGFDVDPRRIEESNANVQKSGVGKLVSIQQKDIFTLDLSNVNVVTLYLLPSLNVKLIPQLEKLKGGSRIVSHDFDMQGIVPDQVVGITSPDGAVHTIYLWTTPLKRGEQQTTPVTEEERVAQLIYWLGHRTTPVTGEGQTPTQRQSDYQVCSVCGSPATFWCPVRRTWLCDAHAGRVYTPGGGYRIVCP